MKKPSCLTRGFTGNQLKILALAAMTMDHIGLELLPGVPLLRILGRLAFPIYGWMIAEGCRHTHDPRRYFFRLASLAAICQAVYFLAVGSLYQCVLVTFSLSVGLIFAYQRCLRSKSLLSILGFSLLLAAAILLAGELPGRPGFRDFAIDYGPWGIVLPLFVYMGRSHGERLGLLTLALLGLGLDYGGIQWWALASVPLLGLYNGQRGKHAIGRFFYLYYPAHLVVIYLLALAIF